ncbi:MAG: Nif3-like dinuclear metal center hexameric protein [Lachnospiraceae bacterium]|jgi:dinuclear metal center YbgI/SA1388 family protein|nr:Nif3-like dinuclear metal center hexameric protein [Lachnospiraceae bacterium]
MKCTEIIKKLEQLFPPALAETYDNVGLLAGRPDKEIKRIYLAVDPTDAVVDDALLKQADLLLTHHPLIFRPMKRIVTDDFIGRRVYTLIRNDICYYALHTNYDTVEMADAAAMMLDLQERRVLKPAAHPETQEGIGRIGRLPQRMTLRECAQLVKERFDLPTVRIYGDQDQTVEWAAISPGSGRSVLQAAVSSPANLLITGDIDHHDGLDCMAQGLPLIDAGHLGLEKIFVPNMREFFRRELPEMKLLETVTQEVFQVI